MSEYIHDRLLEYFQHENVVLEVRAMSIPPIGKHVNNVSPFEILF